MGDFLHFSKTTSHQKFNCGLQFWVLEQQFFLGLASLGLLFSNLSNLFLLSSSQIIPRHLCHLCEMYSKKEKSCICETQRCQIQSLKTKSTVTSTTFSKRRRRRKAASKIMDYFYTQCQDQNFPSHS